ncbi:MAG: histidine ammonia-lyase [Phycisphaerae bacterium]
MSASAIELGGEPLTLDALDVWLDRPVRATLAPAGVERARRGREWVERVLASGATVYGINTGFGHLKNVRIAADQLDQLQENLIISHAVGVGRPAPAEIVRWMLLLKVHMLLAGHSGVRVEIIERLAAWLNDDLLPIVPTRGSLGASGDLAPLAHLVLPLLGRGVFRRRASIDDSYFVHDDPDGASTQTWEALPAAELHQQRGWTPFRLAAKEGLALINGTQFMLSYAANIGVRARRLLDLIDLVYCMSLEGLRGSLTPADPRLHTVRAHPGAQRVAANIRGHMIGSEILASHADCDRVQDPYSLRCAPQVHGAVRDALQHFCDVIEREMNSVTDNPILFERHEGTEARRHEGGTSDGATERPSDEVNATSAIVDALSGGNFHGEPLALVLDYLAIALTDLGNICERRVYLLLNGDDGLPKLLMRDTGLNSGFMLPQYTAAALVNECKVMATPASIDTIPTSLGQEDHVSMGATSAVKCFEILDRLEHIVGIEMMCAAQAIDYRAPLKPGRGPRAAHEIVRKHITHADRDRQFGEDIHASVRLLRENAELLAIARSV